MDTVLQLFFGLLSVVLLGVKFKSDKRDQYLQHGGWIVKVGLWIGFNVIAFLAPVGLVNAYCEPPILSAPPLHLWQAAFLCCLVSLSLSPSQALPVY